MTIQFEVARSLNNPIDVSDSASLKAGKESNLAGIQVRDTSGFRQRHVSTAEGDLRVRVNRETLLSCFDETASPAYKNLASNLVKVLSDRGVDVTVQGAHHIPPRSFILVSNHASNWDAVVQEAVMVYAPGDYHPCGKEAMAYAAKDGLFKGIWRSLGVAHALESVGQFSIEDISQAQAKLASGTCVGIYPEGTRNPSNEFVFKFRPGVIEIAIEGYDENSGLPQGAIPMLPASIKGTGRRPVEGDEGRSWWSAGWKTHVNIGVSVTVDDLVKAFNLLRDEEILNLGGGKKDVSVGAIRENLKSEDPAIREKARQQLKYYFADCVGRKVALLMGVLYNKEGRKTTGDKFYSAVPDNACLVGITARVACETALGSNHLKKE